MKPFILFCLCLALAACNNTTPGTHNTPTPIAVHISATALSQSLPPSETPQIVFEITRVSSPTPWVLSSGLSIEEHPLAKRPEIEPLLLIPLDGVTQEALFAKHANEYQKTLPPNEYYAVGGGNVWVMQGKDKLETIYEGNLTSAYIVGLARNGDAFFSTSNTPPGVTSEFRVLTVYDNSWALELAERNEVNVEGQAQIYFSGRIFVDSQSLNEIHDYEESFGFQTIHGRPFYFYKRDGKIGVSYDGEEIPLDYDGVPHYGCCSAAELNPRIAQNIIGFFAWRGGQWHYVEIGVFSPNSESK